MRGDVAKDGKVLVIKRIHVTYRLKGKADREELIERVRQSHAHSCPVARSIEGCVAITTEVAHV